MRLQLSMKCCELVTGNRMREEASTQEETENKMKCTLENIMYTYESKWSVYVNSFLEEVTKCIQNVTFPTPLVSISNYTGIIYLASSKCLKNHGVRKEFVGYKICTLFLFIYFAPKIFPFEVRLVRFTRGVRRSLLSDSDDIPFIIIIVRFKRQSKYLDKF